MLAAGSFHVTRQAFTGDHQILVQRVVHIVGSCLSVDMAGSG